MQAITKDGMFKILEYKAKKSRESILYLAAIKKYAFGEFSDADRKTPFVISFLESIERQKKKIYTDDWNKNNLSGDGLKERLYQYGVEEHYFDCKSLNIPERLFSSFREIIKGKSAYIYGNVGSGKTYFCATAMKIIIEKDKAFTADDGSIYIPTQKVCLTSSDKLLNALKHKIAINESISEILEPICEIQTLFLDDIATQKMTDFANQSLFHIVDYRYNKDMHTVFTSNKSISQLEATGIDSRIISRINEMCKIIEISEDDRRINNV